MLIGGRNNGRYIVEREVQKEKRKRISKYRSTCCLTATKSRGLLKQEKLTGRRMRVKPESIRDDLVSINSFDCASHSAHAPISLAFPFPSLSAALFGSQPRSASHLTLLCGGLVGWVDPLSQFSDERPPRQHAGLGARAAIKCAELLSAKGPRLGQVEIRPAGRRGRVGWGASSVIGF